jgi:hypothetical protein
MKSVTGPTGVAPVTHVAEYTSEAAPICLRNSLIIADEHSRNFCVQFWENLQISDGY